MNNLFACLWCSASKQKVPVHDLHYSICTTRHVSRKEVSICKLTMHKSGVQPCLHQEAENKQNRRIKKKSTNRVETSLFSSQQIFRAANLVLQPISGGLVVLCKVRETVLCLVCAINDCAHGICRSSSLGTPEVVHSPLRSHLRKQKATCLHICKLIGWVCMKLSHQEVILTYFLWILLASSHNFLSGSLVAFWRWSSISVQRSHTANLSGSAPKYTKLSWTSTDKLRTH